MKAWFLRLHRWVALIFALPLVFVLGTAAVLSFEPWLVTSAIKPGSLTADKVSALLAQHDPAGKATRLSHRVYDGTLQIGRGTIIDVASGQPTAGPSALAATMRTARRMHETLLLDLGWLVLASSFVMIGLAVLGVAMGWPRFANTLGGWHSGAAWVLLPLLVLSPLTGILMAYHISFTGPRAPAPKEPPLKLAEAVRIVGAKHDLSGLIWLRARRGRMLARIVEGGEWRVYTVSRAGTTPTARNWPRLWHEGNFAGMWSSLMNIVTSITMLGLLITGIWIWARRRMRLAARRRLQVV
ncbi:MAG: PepSY domain-containing protein [Hyphomicrobiaceae bacterium]|nr:PepSY domain-containing protein [Hyphomicrobiaceae bacterium]